jgi:hypothetical protein
MTLTTVLLKLRLSSALLLPVELLGWVVIAASLTESPLTPLAGWPN